MVAPLPIRVNVTGGAMVTGFEVLATWVESRIGWVEVPAVT